MSNTTVLDPAVLGIRPCHYPWPSLGRLPVLPHALPDISESSDNLSMESPLTVLVDVAERECMFRSARVR